MYIMTYSIAEFRTKSREALNAVERGEEVIIERFGVEFRLTLKSTKDELQVNPPTVIKGDWSSGSIRLDKKMKGVEPVEKILIAKAGVKMAEDIAVATGEIEDPYEEKFMAGEFNAMHPDVGAPKVCKHGSDPNFCKFAKPGKVCK